MIKRKSSTINSENPSKFEVFWADSKKVGSNKWMNIYCLCPASVLSIQFCILNSIRKEHALISTLNYSMIVTQQKRLFYAIPNRRNVLGFKFRYVFN